MVVALTDLIILLTNLWYIGAFDFQVQLLQNGRRVQPDARKFSRVRLHSKPWLISWSKLQYITTLRGG